MLELCFLKARMTTLEGRQMIMNEMSVHTDRAKGCKQLN